MRTALLAMAFLFLVPLLGINGSPGTAAETAPDDRRATAVAFGPYAERATDGRDSGSDRVRAGGRDGGRGCHEGENRAPRGVLPAPERTGSPAFEAAPAPSGPRDEAPTPTGAAPPDATSVDLYRTQVIRT